MSRSRIENVFYGPEASAPPVFEAGTVFFAVDTNKTIVYGEDNKPVTFEGGAFPAVDPPLQGYTVATLPTGSQGDKAYVTDALAPTFLGTLTGGGTVVTPVFHNGTAWVSA